MNFKAISRHRFYHPAVGAAVTVLCGLLLWQMPAAHWWMDASYDNLFRFGARNVINKVVLIQMDDASATDLHTERLAWDRGLHAELLDKLTAGGAALVVFDVHFREPKDPAKDQQLADAIKRNGKVVLMAKVTDVDSENAIGAKIIPPLPLFAEAATNWGIGHLVGPLVRHHWPFPAPADGYPSLAWTAAQVMGARLTTRPVEQWLRYYGERRGFEVVAYNFARSKQPEFFRNKVVFIGNKPQNEDPDQNEVDKFQKPFVSGDHRRAVGGVEILATEYLNLMNRDWLRRPPAWVEICLLAFSGILAGVGLNRLRRFVAMAASVGIALLVLILAVYVSYYTNYWFPWLILVAGQLPCALVCSLATAKPRTEEVTKTVLVSAAPARTPAPVAKANQTIALSFPEDPLPDAPEYELLTPHIGKGGFGKVWIARNAIGQWQALKAVYAANFGENRGPYEAEFKGLQRYKPVSEKHPGLLRIELVSRMKDEGYFYYVMELGDAQAPGWEKDPQLYKPRDLDNLRKQAVERRLPPAECLRIVTVLADALNFLHQQGLTHRDIKPANVIFVNGRPKLADIGLVADIRPVEEVHTLVGTLGYMPPPPEKPGTPLADIYALGMLLYVISTGRDPDFFPGLSTSLMERSGHAEFIKLNAIILKACQPDPARRYQSTAEMLKDLQDAG